MLNWRSLNPEPSKFLVKGTELAVGFLDGKHRFAIYEIRTREADGYSGTRYVVRDADAITDAEVKEGKRPPVVFHSADLDECVAFARGDEYHDHS